MSDAMNAPSKFGFIDDFNGNDRRLLEAIGALLSLDEANALVPHGIGGHARKLLSAAGARLELDGRMMRGFRKRLGEQS